MMSNMEKLKYCIYGLITGVMVNRLVRRVLSLHVTDPFDRFIEYNNLVYESPSGDAGDIDSCRRLYDMPAHRETTVRVMLRHGYLYMKGPGGKPTTRLAESDLHNGSVKIVN